MRAPARVLAVLLWAPLAVACQSGAGPQSYGTPAGVPFTDCAELTRPPSEAPGSAIGVVGTATEAPGSGAGDPGSGAGEPSASAGGGDGTPLPDLSLPCYRGGADLALPSTRGPAVVNLWASWCAPCRRELPVLRDFAGRNRGAVHVVGVVTSDTGSSSAALGTDLGLTFPHLRDESGRLLRELKRSALPVTLFVDAAGRIRTVYAAEALDREALDSLAEQHLGVVPA